MVFGWGIANAQVLGSIPVLHISVLPRSGSPEDYIALTWI